MSQSVARICPSHTGNTHTHAGPIVLRRHPKFTMDDHATVDVGTGAGQAGGVEDGAGHVCGQGCSDEWEEVFWINTDGEVRSGDCRCCQLNHTSATGFITVSTDYGTSEVEVPETGIMSSNPDGSPLLTPLLTRPHVVSPYYLRVQPSSTHWKWAMPRCARCMPASSHRLPRERLNTLRERCDDFVVSLWSCHPLLLSTSVTNPAGRPRRPTGVTGCPIHSDWPLPNATGRAGCPTHAGWPRPAGFTGWPRCAKD
jgi:hypothetical protein